MIKKILKFNENQNGAVAIIVALFMTTFLGFSALAIDVGVMGVSKNELQNAADAAALAGASVLAKEVPDTNGNVNEGKITTAAKNAANINKASNTQIDKNTVAVALGRWDWNGSSFSANVKPYNAVNVGISNHNTNLFFSNDRVMGADAVAIVGPTIDMEGLIPLAIDEATFNKIDNEMQNKGLTIYEFGQSPGNWGTVDFDGGGGGTPEIGERLVNGYEGTITEGQLIETETGLGKIGGNNNDSKVADLIGLKRYIPVIDAFPGGSGDARVQGFIAIEITGISGKANNKNDPLIITANYLGKEMFGGNVGNVDSGQQTFGLLTVKLVE